MAKTCNFLAIDGTILINRSFFFFSSSVSLFSLDHAQMLMCILVFFFS